VGLNHFRRRGPGNAPFPLHNSLRPTILPVCLFLGFPSGTREVFCVQGFRGTSLISSEADTLDE
jgi:hypothetical protein